MKVLVCGSRHFNDKELLDATLGELDIQTIIEGEARGADTLARKYAEEHSLAVEAFPARWSEFGAAAGPIRNIQMLAEGRPDLVVAFLAPDSRGTKHMIEISEKAGIPVKIVDVS